MKKSSPRLVWPDVIRTLAISLIIMYHIPSSSYWTVANYSPQEPLIGHLYYALAGIGVPLFILLSGALILPKKESLKTLYTHRLPRVIRPWIFWGALYLLWQLYLDPTLIQGDLKSFTYQSFVGGFWFVPMIIGLYLLIPLFRPFTQKADRVQYLNLGLLWFVLISLLPFLGYAFDLKLFQYTIPLAIAFSGYFLLGPQLTKSKLTSRVVLITFFLTWFLAFVFRLAEARQQIGYLPWWQTFFTPMVVIMSLSIFVALYKSQWVNSLQGNLRQLFLLIATYSYGIFLSHSLLIQVAHHYIGDFSLHFLHPVISIPLEITLIGTASFVTVYILSRLPFLKKWVT